MCHVPSPSVRPRSRPAGRHIPCRRGAEPPLRRRAFPGRERHDAPTVLAWLERVGRVLPDLTLTPTDVTVAGWPANTTAVVPWNAHVALADGGEPYRNGGVHVIHMRWLKITEMDVYQDAQVLADALHRRAAHGVDEAAAPQITS